MKMHIIYCIFVAQNTIFEGFDYRLRIGENEMFNIGNKINFFKKHLEEIPIRFNSHIS